MISFQSFLKEIQYQDIYPKTFNDFMKKWKAPQYKGNDYRYWVNFTMNPKADILDRNIAPAESTTHSDPAGMYGYPLRYVVDYPADVWYGRGAKYLRVFETVGSPRFLYLQEMNDSDIYRILWEFTGNRDKLLRAAKKRYRCNSKQALFKITQVENIDEYFFQKSYEDVKPIIKSNAEQTKFWQSMGYDGLVDEARNQKSAIINDREPWQIVVFNKKHFRFVDIYQLNAKSTHLSHGGLGTSEDEEHMKRKLAALIAGMIGDKLANGDRSMFWTKAGRRISIEFYYPDSYIKNLSWGEKPHKQSKKYDANRIKVNIYWERGPYSYSWDSNTRFVDIAKEIASDFKSAAVVDGFKPEYNRKQYDEEEKRLRFIEYDKQNVALVKRYLPDIEKCAELYGVKWNSELTDEDLSGVYNEMYIKDMRLKSPDLEEHFTNKVETPARTQTIELMNAMLSDDTKITRKNRNKKNEKVAWGEDYETTVGESVEEFGFIDSNFFSDKKFLIFPDVLKWRGVTE